MKKITIGILAHVDAGKTTLSEALLYKSGKINNVGRVDNKDCFLDTDEQERDRGITIFSKQALFDWNETNFTLIDTPGHVDFSAEMERTLQILDYAILLISATDMVQGHTITLWNKLKQYNIPTFIFVNKMDQPDTNASIIIDTLKSELSENIINFNNLNNDLEALEEIAMSSSDEEVLEHFLETNTISNLQISELILDRSVFPCYFGSALKLEGIENLLSGMDVFITSPNYNDMFGAKVFKISRDNQNNRLTHIKVTGGSIKVRDSLSTGEKITQIRVYSGEKYESVNEVSSGDVCCLLGLNESYSGQGFGFEKDNSMKMIVPVINYELIVEPGISTRKIFPDVKKLEEELPEIGVEWNEKDEKISLRLMGEVHLEIITELIKKKLGFVPVFDMGRIIYKETISDTVIGVGHFEPLRHYAEVHLRIEPNDRGKGIEIATDCSEDILDKNWQRLIVTHLNERSYVGVLTGSFITDMKITVINGRAHIKHTEGGDFRQATYRAVRHGLMQAQTVLLEPYYDFRLTVPNEMLGRAMTDMNNLYAKMEPPISENNKSIIIGRGPVSTLRNYHANLNSYTGGKGELSVSFSGYDICHNQDEVVDKIGYNPDSDIDNPSSSVFCSHGAGVIIPWYEVSKYQHLIDDVDKDYDYSEVYENIQREGFDYSIGLDEIDEIMSRTYSSNQSERKKAYQKRTHQTDYTSHIKSSISVKKEGTINIIDGYNVIFAWKDLKELSEINIDSAKDKLISILSNLHGIINQEIIIVFDGYKSKGNIGSETIIDDIKVVHTKEGQIADHYIEKFVNDNIKKYDINVYSSDGMIQTISRGIGARIYSSRELETFYKEKNTEFKEQYNIQ